MKDEYPFIVRPLSEEDGSGYLIEYPDLPGCISDGETPEEAIANGRDAVKSYIASCREFGDKVPKPGRSASGQWRQRVPKTLHSRLVTGAARGSEPQYPRYRDDCGGTRQT